MVSARSTPPPAAAPSRANTFRRVSVASAYALALCCVCGKCAPTTTRGGDVSVVGAADAATDAAENAPPANARPVAMQPAASEPAAGVQRAAR